MDLDVEPRGRYLVHVGTLDHEVVPMERIIDAFRDWIPRLGLQAWHLEVETVDELGSGAIMEIRRADTADRGVLTVARWVVDAEWRDTMPQDVDTTISPQFVEACVVHELLHLVTRDLWFAVHDVFEDKMDPAAFDVLGSMLRRIEEQTVDRLSSSLVRSWPS